MNEGDLNHLISGCIKQDRNSQKLLYKAFYGFCMGICLRYAGNRDEAAEVMNQGFFKVLSNIERYDASRPFKAWLGKIMVNVSIDHYRANLKMAYMEDIDQVTQISDGGMTDKKLNYDDLLAMIQKLPQAYRTVFNLFAIEGYSHEEIGEMLGIAAGTSKSNLHKARLKLKQMICHAEQTAERYRYTGGGIEFNPIVAITGTDVKKGFFSNKFGNGNG